MPATKKKPAKQRTKKEVVHIGLLLDESGSMGPNQATVIRSVNEFVENLRKDAKEKDMRATLAMFDDRVDEDNLRIRFDAIPFAEARPLVHGDYQPWGGTPLNDAIVDTIEHMSQKTKKGEKVMLVILTDGYENASNKSSTNDVRDLIKKREKDGWAFIYLGANQDAWAEGGARGMGQASSYSFTSSAAGTSSTIGTVTNDAKLYANSSVGQYRQASGARGQSLASVGGALPEGVVIDVADFVKCDFVKDEEEEKK